MKNHKIIGFSRLNFIGKLNLKGCPALQLLIEKFPVQIHPRMIARSPQSEENVIEWYRRLVLLSGKDLDTHSYNLDLDKVTANYLQISYKRIEQIVQEYNIDYYIGPESLDLPFQTVYSTGILAVYELRSK